MKTGIRAVLCLFLCVGCVMVPSVRRQAAEGYGDRHAAGIGAGKADSVYTAGGSVGTDAPDTITDAGKERADATATALRQRMYEAFLRESETLNLTEMTVGEDEIQYAYSCLLSQEPELYFVAPRYTLGMEGSRVIYLKPEYRMTGEARKEAQETFETAATELLRPVGAVWSDTEKVAYLHDTLISRFAYDDTYRVYDAYGLLVGGVGVCQAYALLFRYLCERVGLPCVCAVSFEREHAWNQVQVDGAWYHIDLTWDESNTPYLGRVRHTWFLLSDREAMALRTERDSRWAAATLRDVPYRCTNERFAECPLRASMGASATMGDGNLYFAAGGNLYVMDTATDVVTLVMEGEEGWDDGVYTALAGHGETLYFNMPRQLYVLEKDGDTPRKLGDALTDGNLLYYGVALCNGHLAVQTLLRDRDNSA